MMSDAFSRGRSLGSTTSRPTVTGIKSAWPRAAQSSSGTSTGVQVADGSSAMIRMAARRRESAFEKNTRAPTAPSSTAVGPSTSISARMRSRCASSGRVGHAKSSAGYVRTAPDRLTEKVFDLLEEGLLPGVGRPGLQLLGRHQLAEIRDELFLLFRKLLGHVRDDANVEGAAARPRDARHALAAKRHEGACRRPRRDVGIEGTSRS